MPSERHSVVQSPALGGRLPDAIEPSRVTSKSPVLVDRHPKATASIYGKGRARTDEETIPRDVRRPAVLIESDAASEIRRDDSHPWQVIEKPDVHGQGIHFVSTEACVHFDAEV